MANKKIGFDFVPILNINDMKKNVGQIETIFKDLKLSPNFTASIQNEFKELYKSIGNYEKNIGKSKQGTIGVKQLQTSAKEVERIYSNIVKNFQKLDRTDIVNSFKIDTTEIQQLNQQIEDISKNFTISSDTSAYFEQIQTDIQNTQIKTHKWAQSLNSVNFNPLQSKNISASIEEIGEKIKEGNTQIKSYTTQLNNLKATQASLQQKKDSGIISADEEKTLNALPAKITRVSQNLDTYKRIVDNLSKIQKNFSSSQDESARKIEELRSTIKRLVEQGYNELEEGLKDAQSGAEKASDGIKEFNDNLIRVTNTTEQNARDLSNIFDQLTRFATIGGQIQILRNVIRSAYQDVKELDKVMNSIAVVSDETTKSLWNQSNAYAELASSMGTSIVGAYEVAKLYYQQGREASQITSLTTDTLKLARLAELDYADATDYMTVALNGFNMAANESINIVDVYSNLAAKAAADQSEIAIAMSKTASLANSVGMSFENTSAFLTKIIETTRESAETSGTALKISA